MRITEWLIKQQRDNVQRAEGSAKEREKVLLYILIGRHNAVCLRHEEYDYRIAEV